MSETVLVTGGFGLVGSATVRRLAALGRQVVATDLDTPANRNSMPGPPERYARWAQPAEIAAAILWLASTDNRLTSGAALPVYGRS